MTSNHHHRCNRCGRDFGTGEALEAHVTKRHPKANARWWVVAENPIRTASSAADSPTQNGRRCFNAEG